LRTTAVAPRWYFNIPYRCLVPMQVDNMLVAGRCISVSHEASGCARTTVQCMVTGQAAGTAAAMCVKQNVTPRKLNTYELQEILTDQRVVL
ncbi:MAG: FAD-dependent oxidoreductase, partial [Armatimonadota bacterium]